jgi:hypothetical protein
MDGELPGNEPPDIDAVREFDATVAAADGSREDESVNAFPSGMELGICVGELFLGFEFEPRKSFFENVRASPPTPLVDWIAGEGAGSGMGIGVGT